MIKQRVSLSQLQQEMWTDEHMKTIEIFVTDVSKRTLIFYIDSIAGFTVSTNCPVFQVDELQYFIRKEGVEMTPTNVGKTLQYGKVRGNYLESLLRIMTGIYGPQFFRNTTWPDSILLYFFNFCPCKKLFRQNILGNFGCVFGDNYHLCLANFEFSLQIVGPLPFCVPIELLSMSKFKEIRKLYAIHP